MIISRIIQNGLDLSIETNDIPYQRSANHKIQFVKDSNYTNYSLQAYGKLPKTGYQESEEFKLELEDGNYIKLPSAVFATKGIFQIAISLTGTSGDIINLGIVSYKIRKSFGDSTNILPDNEKAWNSFVHLEVDNYFKNTYQSKLDDVNTKLNEINKKTEETKQLKNEVISLKNDVTNLKNEANQAATKAETNANKTQESLNKFNQDMANTTADIDKRIDKLNATATTMEERINKALDSIPNDYSDLQKQVNEVEDRELKDANGITQSLTITDGYAQLTDAATKRLNSLVIRGNSEQIKTTGKNLLEPYGSFPKTSSNITFDLKEDGFHINGKCSGNSSYIPIYSNTLQPGTYYVNGITGGSNSSYQLMVFKNDTIMGYATYNNFKITLSESATIKLQLYVYSSYGTFNDLVLPYMICKNESELTTYEPYTGGQPSPNPDYPQEIKAVSNLSALTVGKNLCGGYDFSKSAHGIDVVVKNSTININGTPAGNYPTVILYPNGDVVLQQWWLDSDSLRKKNIYKNKGFYAHDLKEKTLQIDFDGTFDVNGGELFYVVVGYETYGEYKNFSSKSTILFNLSTKERINYIAIGFTGTAKISNFNVKIQLKYDKNKSDFISYQGQSILNYTLQNPLYKLGDTQDYIDLIKGKIIRNVGVVTFDGSDDEGWCLSLTQYTNNIRFYTSILGDSTIHLNLLVLCNKFSYIKNMQGNDLMGISYTNTLDIQLDKSNLSTQDLTGFKTWLNKNPITVVYQLATPTEEDIPQELLTQLKQLQTYSGETNISFEASDVYPTIDLEYIKDTKKYIESKTDLNAFVENMFALQRTGKVYTVKFPLWTTSHISTGEKLDDNAGLVCEPSTKTIKGQNDYENIPLFKTYDVNAYVDEYGARHITAIKGQDNFKDTGKNDVFVLGMSYYEKVWSDDQYWYYSRTDSPRDGYTIARECVNRDGSIQAFGLYAKYVAGNIDGDLYSSKGLKPARYYGTTPLPANTTNTNTSYSGLISQCHKRGSFYSGGMTCDYKYILTTFYLKYGTLNTQSIMGGCNNYSAQYEASIKSSTNNTYFPLTKAQADYFPVGASVSIGYKYGGSNLDRYYSTVSIYADNVKIIKKVALDDSNTALYLDTNTPFNTANTSSGAVFCSTMHWRSGFSDNILGRDGCPCDTKSELTNGKFPIVIQGIECMVGGYETYGNAFMDIVDATGKREVYIQNDASQLTTDIATAKSTYKKSPYAIQPISINSWNYITKIDFDLANGAFIQTNSGQSGSSTGSGFADGLYVDNANSGQREFLGFGGFSLGSEGGLSCLDANVGVGGGSWYTLARLSINGVWGELTTK